MTDAAYGFIAGVLFAWIASRALFAARRVEELARQVTRGHSMIETYASQLQTVQKQLGAVDYHALSQSFERWKERASVFTEDDRRRMDAAAKEASHD